MTQRYVFLVIAETDPQSFSDPANVLQTLSDEIQSNLESLDEPNLDTVEVHGMQSKVAAGDGLNEVARRFIKTVLVDLDVPRAFAEIPDRATLDALRTWAQL